MRKVLRGITIDNGGSEVRVLPNGSSLSDMITMSSDFVEIAQKDFRVKEVHEPKNLCLIKKAPKSEYLGIIAQGLTGKSYNGVSLVLNAGEDKTKNINYYKQFIFAVARDAIDAYLSEATITPVKKGLFKKVETYENEEITYKYVIVTCIPIREHSGSKDCAAVLKNNIAGEYEVKFPLLPSAPTVRFIIESKYVGVTPEGGVAIAMLRNQLKEDDVTLVVDLGRLTADIALFRGTSLLGKVESSTYAGSMLVGEVKAALEEEGYKLTDEQAEYTIRTGAVRVGAHDENVSKIIDECRINFVANNLKEDILRCLQRNKITSSQVQNFLPIGAAMSDTGKGSVQRAVIDSCGLKDATVINVNCDRRYVNIKAASVYLQKLFEAAKQAEESAEA